eukprot:3031988-Rhodomonas_salina.1
MMRLRDPCEHDPRLTASHASSRRGIRRRKARRSLALSACAFAILSQWCSSWCLGSGVPNRRRLAT